MQGDRPDHRSSRRRHRAGAVGAWAIALLAAPGVAQAFVSSTVTDGRLVARSDDVADIVKVSCGADLMVKVNGLPPTHGSAACPDIVSVHVLGFGGPDTINLSRVGPRNGFTNSALRKPYSVQAFGGSGADHINGSRLPDLLVGGAGHDVMRGRAGNDLLRGGPGSDRLVGGKGSDRLFGGPGVDRILGGTGKNFVRQ